MNLSGFCSDLKQLGVIGLFVLSFINVVIVLGVVQIVATGWSQKVHCSVDSSVVNITKWTSTVDSISRYSMSATLRIDNQVFTLKYYDITPQSLRELLNGTGDTNKQRDVRILITHVLHPISNYPQPQGEYPSSEDHSCISDLIGHAYQTCYVNYGEYYFSRPPDQDLSKVAMIAMLVFADIFFIIIYRFTKINSPNAKR